MSDAEEIANLQTKVAELTQALATEADPLRIEEMIMEKDNTEGRILLLQMQAF